MKFIKWKKYWGVKHLGTQKYNPSQPWGPWTKTLGVVARCEGNHDTVVSYDTTGLTWGFMQWTFPSGRLQKLLHFMQSLPVYDFTREEENIESNLFLYKFTDPDHGGQIFENFGFQILDSSFVDVTGDHDDFLNPAVARDKKQIRNVCMGYVQHKSFKKRRQHALDLAKVFAEAAQDPAVQLAQIDYAKIEFRRHLDYKRSPLGEIKTIRNLLGDSWDTPLPALFFNLWQNNPAAAYRLFLRARKDSGFSGAVGEDAKTFFDLAWKYTNRSRFGNWGWGKKANKWPRVMRIKKAIKEFYGITLPYYK